MSASPAVSVIIPARDAAPTLEHTIDCLRRQDLSPPFEVIVVDDGSRDHTVAIATRHQPFVKLVQTETSRGPGAARNRGVATATAPILAFTDADCFPEPEWLTRGLEALAGADIVQGRVEPDPRVPRTPFDRSLSVHSDEGFYQTANLFVRREWFDRVGGFRDWALDQPGRRRWSADRRRGRAMRTPIGEDTVFAWSARRGGARSRYAADALVRHAVVPGGLRDAAADRWHWTRDMPELARLVPELRDTVFYRRWFFAEWSAGFDLAVATTLAAAMTRRPILLAGTLPYLDRVRREANLYRDGKGSRAFSLRRAFVHALGAPVIDAVTLTGFVAGSIAWRSLVV